MGHFPGSNLAALLARIEALEAGHTTAPTSVDPDYYSTIGITAGGASVASGSVNPAIAGEIIPNPGATAWVKITGTAAQVGDAVFVQYEGRRTASPGNPASRLDSGAGPGALGTNTLNAGEIEITLSGANTDNNKVFWFIVRKGV